MSAAPVKHDEGCPGCATGRRAAANDGVARMRLYIAYCDEGNHRVDGDTEHVVGGRTLCEVHAPPNA